MPQYNYNPNPDPQMFGDIRELCSCTAKAVAVIGKRYNEDPRLINKLFIQLYQQVDEEVNNRT